MVLPSTSLPPPPRSCIPNPALGRQVIFTQDCPRLNTHPSIAYGAIWYLWDGNLASVLCILLSNQILKHRLDPAALPSSIQSRRTYQQDIISPSSSSLQSCTKCRPESLEAQGVLLTSPLLPAAVSSLEMLWSLDTVGRANTTQYSLRTPSRDGVSARAFGRP